MKQLLLIFILSFSTIVHAQNSQLIKLAFQDKTNFDITTKLDNKRPSKLYVIGRTENWETCRFFINENIKSDSIRKLILNDEHHHYNDCYVFKDPILDRLFTDKEKLHLYQCAKSKKSRIIINGVENYLLIKSFDEAKNGFFFTVTDPIISSDSQFAFIEIISHKKTKETKEFNHTYFGRTFLIYKRTKAKGWTRFKKIDFLIL